jgi:FdhD protein
MKGLPTFLKTRGRALQNGRFTDTKPNVIVESELRIVLNGEHLATASLMPGMEKEFVTGYLFGQGFIKTPKDIASLVIEDSSARVTLLNTAAPLPSLTNYRIVSGGGRTAFADDSLPRIQSDLRIKKDAVFAAMNRLFDMGTLYKKTEGAHAAGIFTAEADPVNIVEDIGRHNCLDKAIGYALLSKIDCSRHFMVSTGRMSSEMVAKLCRAGFPVAATKTAVTDRGREIALACGITLIGFVRDTGMKIHTDMTVRIIGEPIMKIYTGDQRITLF